MSVDIVIKQKGFFKKKLSLKDILMIILLMDVMMIIIF